MNIKEVPDKELRSKCEIMFSRSKAKQYIAQNEIKGGGVSRKKVLGILN